MRRMALRAACAMRQTLMIILSLHVLAAVFWAGSTAPWRGPEAQTVPRCFAVGCCGSTFIRHSFPSRTTNGSSGSAT